MLDCLSSLAHGFWVCIEALLHSLEQMLMLPSCNPPLWPCRALRFKRTILTGCGPVAPQHLAVFLAREAIWQLLPSWTAIGVLLWQIDKVLLAEAAIRLGARRLRLGQSYRDAGLVAREDLQAAESSRDRQRPRASRSGEQPSPAWHARCQRYNPANTRRSRLMKVSRCGDLRPSTLSG